MYTHTQTHTCTVGAVCCSTNHRDPSMARPGARRTASESPPLGSASLRDGFVCRTHGTVPSLPAQLSVKILDLSIFTASATSVNPSNPSLWLGDGLCFWLRPGSCAFLAQWGVKPTRMTQVESGGGVAFKGSVGFCYQKKGTDAGQENY